MSRPHGGQAPPGELDFSASINPLGPPSGVLRALRTSVGEALTRYPYRARERFRETVARRHGLPKRCVLVAAGVGELLALLGGRLSGGSVQVGVPAFTEYEDLLAARAARLETVPLSHEGPDGDELARRFSPGTADAIVLCNPNNPTGWAIETDQLRPLAERCRRQDCLLVVDEAYVSFLRDPGTVSMADHVERVPSVLVLRSLTKFYGFPGLRIGYALGSPDQLRTLRELQNPWPTGLLAYRAGEAAFEQDAFAARTRRFVAAQRSRVRSALESVTSLRVLPSRVNFLLARCDRPDVVSDLRRRGIHLRDARSFTGLGAGWFRFALRGREDNTRLVRELRRELEASPSPRSSTP